MKFLLQKSFVYTEPENSGRLSILDCQTAGNQRTLAYVVNPTCLEGIIQTG